MTTSQEKVARIALRTALRAYDAAYAARADAWNAVAYDAVAYDAACAAFDAAVAVLADAQDVVRAYDVVRTYEDPDEDG